MVSSRITLETYKELSTQEFLKGDEKFTSIITNYDEELFYEPDQEG